MSIHSQEVDRLDPSGSKTLTHVFRACDRLGGGEVYVRTVEDPTSQESSSLLEQFTLHRTLRYSGVVDAYDLIVSSGQVSGFTLPIVTGQALSDCLRILQPHEALVVLRDVAFASFSLHSLGYIHGDLSANNVWCVADGNAKRAMLMDLGFSTRIGTRLATEVRGTDGYISPEALGGRPLGAASDAYAFGKLIELCISRIPESPAVADLARLSEECLKVNENDRLSDFARVYASLVRIGHESLDSLREHTSYSLPLRPAGLAARSGSLRERLTSHQGPGLYCVTGESGSGKSELLRHACHALQRQGHPTLRVCGVSLTSVFESLRSLRVEATKPMPEIVFIETPDGNGVESDGLKEWRDLSTQLKLKLVVECRFPQPAKAAGAKHSVHCRPLTFRECMHASSHLLVNHGIVSANTEAVYACTRGIPGDIRDVMTDWFIAGRRGRGEPVDFRSPLSLSLLKLNTRMSHNSRLPDSDSPDGSLSKLLNRRQSLRNDLLEYRNSRSGGRQPGPLLPLRLSEGFGNLGSLGRQARWLNHALSASHQAATGRMTALELFAVIQTYGLALPPPELVERLSELKAADDEHSKRIRFLVRSELGKAHLLMRKPKDAQIALREARALCNDSDISSEYEAMILNRLGTAKMMAGESEAAREYFSQAARAAQANGDWTTLIAVSGNMGFLEVQNAEPMKAIQWIRRRRLLTSKKHRFHEYTTNLLNETRALVDLGKGHVAEKKARVALDLSETLSDRLRLGFARNNLGWILSMRCRGRAAFEELDESRRIRESIADPEAIAQTHLNLARIFLIGRYYDRAEEYTQQAESCFASSNDQEGLRDCQRVRARHAILLGQYDSALLALEPVLTDRQSLPGKDLIDALLLRLEAQLWMQMPDVAESTLREIDASPVVSRIHPLKARRESLAGLLTMQKGELSRAYTQISSAVSMCRESGREDLLLDAMTAMASLASKMNNVSTSLRYLNYVKSMTDKVRGELE